MASKKPSAYYTCDPTTELIRHTALLAAWCAALLAVLFAISAAGELLRHLTQQPEIHATRPK